MNDKDTKREMYRYLIRVQGPPVIAGNSTVYSTDQFAGGYVEVFKVLEGDVPHRKDDIKHATYVGSFRLKQDPDKTPEEFMKEIKDGVASLVSE